MKHKLIILYGPTAVGKTDLSFLIDNLIPIEIINGDIGQFYEPLAIGTAKPDWKSQLIPHHLFDYCDTPRDVTVVEYRTLVIKTMESIWSREKVPVLVGGSGFYLKSLFFPPKDIEKIIVNSIDELPSFERLSSQELWDQLYALDAQRASSISPNDRYRLERAMQLIHYGVQPSEQAPEYVPLPADVLFIAVTRDREELYNRINDRTTLMLENGWIEEVQKIVSIDSPTMPWVNFLLRKKIIGYDDIIRYLCTDPASFEMASTKKALIETIQQKTRRYAKRQLTFLRMLEKLMRSHVTKPSHMVIITQDHERKVLEQVSEFLCIHK